MQDCHSAALTSSMTTRQRTSQSLISLDQANYPSTKMLAHPKTRDSLFWPPFYACFENCCLHEGSLPCDRTRCGVSAHWSWAALPDRPGSDTACDWSVDPTRQKGWKEKVEVWFLTDEAITQPSDHFSHKSYCLILAKQRLAGKQLWCSIDAKNPPKKIIIFVGMLQTWNIHIMGTILEMWAIDSACSSKHSGCLQISKQHTHEKRCATCTIMRKAPVFLMWKIYTHIHQNSFA